MFRAYDLLSDAIILVELDKRGDKHKIKFINSAAINLSGFTRAEVVGKSPNIFMPTAIADLHDTYIAQWKMKKGEQKGEHSKSERSDSGNGFDEECPRSMIRIVDELDMARGQVRAVPLKKKDGVEVPVHIRLNIFAESNQVFALATLRQQLIVPHVDFADTIFHIVDKEALREEKRSTLGETSCSISLSKGAGVSTGSRSDREEGDERPTPTTETLNVYINPPISFSDFPDLKKWTFQPDNLSQSQRAKYARLLQEKIMKSMSEAVKEKWLIPSYLHAPGIPLSGEDMDNIKQQMVVKFNSISGTHRDPISKCMVSLSSNKNHRVLVPYGGV
jgi:PAS domain S-box-containing protein